MAAAHREPARRWRFLPPLAILLAILVLGTLALHVGAGLLHREEASRLAARAHLVERLARWESDADAPAGLSAAVDRTPFRPGDGATNANLLPGLQLSPSGDVTRVLALLDRAGTVSAAYPPGNTVVPRDLGAAWSSAWAGTGAVSPVFRLGNAPVRATVVPVGSPRPWAVLVAVSTREINLQLSGGIATMLGAGSGSVSTIDPNGVPIASTDPALPGRRILPAAELRRSRERSGAPRIWRTSGPAGTITHITAPQPTTGYLTYFQQPTDSLYADLRARGDRRNLTLLAVALTGVLCIVFLGLLREAAARRCRAGLRALFAAAHDIVLVTDPAGRLTFVSPAIVPLLGHPHEPWLGRMVTELAHPDDAARLLRLIENPTTGSLLDVRLTPASGADRWFDVAARRLPARAGVPEVLITCHAVDKRKRLLDQLGYQAGHDVLTGLLNRSTFEEELAAALTAASPRPADAIAVLFVDLDRFKPVNDTFGHAAGDQVLQTVGARIRSELATVDAGGRFGGDEFGILLRDTDEAAARAAAARIIRAVGQPILVDGYEVRVAASVGLALAGAGPCRPERLLWAADQAMYRAKQVGPGRYAVAVPAPPGGDTVEFTIAEPLPVELPDGTADEIVPATADPRPAAAPGPVEPPGTHPGVAPWDVAGGVTPATQAGPLSRTDRLRLSWQRRTSVRAQLSRAVPLLVLGTVILTTTMITLGIENANRRRAETQRVADSHALAVRLAEFAANLSHPRYLIDPISRLPWSLADPAADGRTLAAIAEPSLSTSGTLLALVDADGRPRAVQPPGAAVPFPAHSRVWASARDNGLNVPVLDGAGGARVYSVVPVRRAGRSAAFLVLGRTLHGPSAAEMARALGWGTAATGVASAALDLGMTISIVDEHGRVAMSNDAAAGGRIVVDPAELRTITPGHSQRVTVRDGHGGGRVAVATEIPTSPLPAYLVLRRDDRGTAEGPRPNHALSDVLLVAIVVITVAGLMRALLREDQAIRRDGARLQTLLHESHDIILNLNRAGSPTFISSAIESLLGYPVETRIGRPLLELVHPEDRAGMRGFLAERQRGNPASLLDVRMCTADGGYRWFDIEAGAWRAASGPGYLDGGLLLTCHEVGERRQLQEQLRQRATRDPLTGLANRVALTELLDRLAKQRSPFAILLIDLDDFKPVNDTFGHQAGDDVLRTIAARLTEVLRAQYGVPERPATERPATELPEGQPVAAGSPRAEPPDGAVFRLGGDEFVMVLPDIDADALRRAAQRVRETVAAPILSAGHALVVRATVGLASSRTVDGGAVARNPDLVVRHADADMYAAKRAARARRAMFPATH
ncbi:diguanylate cyclase domain-containing protein [Frankia sp. QA3]|uniref:diguanylate cyclase domain-containing protein n=1 Tax=Frankia sp. QA3 TaxID=710111 RepID=UPI000269C59B|nr:diguanylate cyclase [Frankia sp. QA3]EIV94408.1 PAS domain S-box/diguanylate cyclase (GGDEF) domain-containing protein [Frankia sp. QA3]